MSVHDEFQRRQGNTPVDWEKEVRRGTAEAVSEPAPLGNVLTCPTCQRPHVGAITLQPNIELAETLKRLEQKVDALSTALLEIGKGLIAHGSL